MLFERALLFKFSLHKKECDAKKFFFFAGTSTEDPLLWNSPKMEENIVKGSSKVVLMERNHTGLVENLVTIVDNLTMTKKREEERRKEKEGGANKEEKEEKEADMVPDPREVVDYEANNEWQHSWEEGISSPGINFFSNP